MKQEELKKCREEIDSTDRRILELFQKRMRIVAEVAELKKESGMAILDRSRERDILMNIAKSVPENMSKYSVNLFSVLLELSRAYQRELNRGESEFRKEIEESLRETPETFPETATAACMGMEGSYAQIATDKLFKVAKIMYVKNFAGVFQAVDRNLCEYGILPIDNTTAGTVDAVYDLMKEYHFHIVRSFKLQVSHVLMTKPGVSPEEITEVYSHPHALRQCSSYLREHGYRQIPCESTATAARMVADSPERGVAAIASRECLDIYGLRMVSNAVQDSDYNYTRFICISRKPYLFPGSNKISLMAVLPHKPGALHHIISKFAVLGINLTKLESRPISGREFEYMFYFDFEASVKTPGVISLLEELKAESEWFAFLGNYQEM